MVVTTEGSGVNPGRIAWDATNQKLLVTDARGADTTVFVYQFNNDGTNETKLGVGISTSTVIDQATACQVTSNNRIAYQSGNRKGIMDLDGSTQSNFSTTNVDFHDLAPTEFVDECYFFDAATIDLQRADYEAGGIVEVLDAVSVAAIVTDRANISESFAYWRFGKTLRRVSRDGTGDTEIYDGIDITDMNVLIGIDSGRIYFIYTLAGEVFIGSVTKAGADFMSHGRIDVIAGTLWAANCATIAPETAGS